MNRRPRWLGVALSVGILTVLASSIASREYASQEGGLGAPCVGILDGAKLPVLVPAVFTWSDFLQQVRDSSEGPARTDLAGSMGLLSEELSPLQPLARRALERRDALRRAPPSPAIAGGLMDDAREAAAEAVMEGRDDIIRVVTEAKRVLIEDRVRDSAKSRHYTFEVPGKIVPRSEGGTRCHVQVNGREHFAMIPDYYVWESYFRIKKTSMESVTDRAEYYRAQQRSHLAMPIADIALVMDIAQRAIDEVDLLRASARDHQTMLTEIAATVNAAKARLVRTLSRPLWRAVQSDAREMHGGTTFDFPTDM